jgi:hypothetical protein
VTSQPEHLKVLTDAQGAAIISVRACSHCGALVAASAGNHASSINNEQAHREWHDRLERRYQSLWRRLTHRPSAS